MLASLVVDFNSFFASVEQQLRPELRGRPVAVAPSFAETTCAIAASYEAKRYGVKTGTMIREAKEMCPGLVIVQARHEEYIHFHHLCMKAVDRCVMIDRVMSIDEVACHLTGKLRERENAIKLAHEIKQTLYRDAGECLRCSIGIAPNAFLAKTASDMQKPDGLVVIEKSDLPEILHHLDLRDLCGIGPAMEERLHDAGIRRVEQLCAVSKLTLHQVWGGVEGDRMWEQLHGNLILRDATRKSSVGHSKVLAPARRTEENARAVLHRLVQKAAMRLRKYEHLAGNLHLSINYVDRTKWRADTRFQETDDTVHFIHALNGLWQDRPLKTTPMIKVGIALTHLIHRTNATLSLFAEQSAKRQALNQALDQINAQFGRNAVYYAGAHAALDAARIHIAFQHVPGEGE